MIDILIFISVLAAVVILVPLIMKNDKGCTGSCEQGRKPCDCKGNEDGIS